MRQKWLQKPPLGTPINFSHPSAKGLVLDLVFQEGEGNLANDLSGNANHGTLKNMAFPATTASGWNPGKFGPAPKFDGTDDEVDIGNPTSINETIGSGSFTIAMWIKTDQVPAGNSELMKKYYNGFLLRLTSAGKAMFFLYDGTNIESITSIQTINDNAYHYIVAVRNKTSGKLELYVDSLSNTPINDTTVDLTSANSLIIGTQFNSARYEGLIDQVRVHNRALSTREIIDSYVNPFARFERTKWGLLVPTAPPIGLSIPVAMHNYRRLRA